MVETVKSLLDSFSPENREPSKKLAALLGQDPESFQRAVVKYLSNEGEAQSVRLVIWLLQREGKLLEIILNPEMSSLDESIAVAKVMKEVVDQVDVQLARMLKGADDDLAQRILRLLAAICDSNRTLPLLIRTLREQSTDLRAKAAFIFARYCQNSIFAEHALRDPEPDVRSKALEGLCVAEYPPDASVLIAAMNDSHPDVRARVFLTYYRLGISEGALQKIGGMTQHPQVAFRSAAAWALGQIGNHRCVRMLELLSEDPDEGVRNVTKETLARIEWKPASEAPEEEAPQKRDLTVYELCATVKPAGQRNIYVAVCDASGEPVLDLDGHDFQIEEGGRTMSCIVGGPSTRKPLSVAWVLDCSGSMSAAKIQETITAVVKSAESKGPQDRMAVYKYSFDIQSVGEFIDDAKRLHAVIRRPFLGAKTASRLHDAIWQALDDTLLQEGQRIVVAIADGIDRGSDHTFPAVVRRCRSIGIPLYVIGFGAGTASRDLASLGHQAGGKFLEAQNGSELSAACKSLMRQLANHYSITYESADQPAGPVRIVVKIPAGTSETSTELIELED